MGGHRLMRSNGTWMRHSASDNAMKPFNLILLGDPAAGKGTQAARLAKTYRMYNFDMGREVRKPAVRAKFDYAGTTGSGHLTPTAIVRDILQHTIRTAPSAQGLLFNGHPKMIGEARLTAKWLREAGRRDPLIIYLSIPAAEVFRRAEKRLVRIGGRLVRREDDSGRALMNRHKYYREQVAHAVAFFRARYPFKKISGMGTEAEVYRRIVAAIKKWSP
jgi:adenylate kinase